jgi:hypothetical protein
VVGNLNETLIVAPVDPVDPAYVTALAAGQHFAANLWPERPAKLRPVLTLKQREPTGTVFAPGETAPLNPTQALHVFGQNSDPRRRAGRSDESDADLARR